MSVVIAGLSISVVESSLDGGINDVFEWIVERQKNGGGYSSIGTYNLATSGHYSAPDDEVEGSTGTFSFSYATTIPVDAQSGDVYQYRFTAADAWLSGRGISIVRESEEFTTYTAGQLTQVYAGQEITIIPGNLDGGINDVFEWIVSRQKNGSGFSSIGTYNLATSGHYSAPDDEVEGSTGTFSFSYETIIPVDAQVGDIYQYSFEAADAWLSGRGISVLRYSGGYITIVIGAVNPALGGSLFVSSGLFL